MSEVPITKHPVEFVRATPQGRWLTIALLLFAVALVAFFLWYALPLLHAALGLQPSPHARSIFKIILLGFAAMIFLSAAVLVYAGSKILRSGQCPPPDAWVARDTPVKRGAVARRIAWAYIAAGAASCLLAAVTVAYMWPALGRVATPELHPGAIILPGASAEKAPAVK